jgi:hypothetical protein
VFIWLYTVVVSVFVRFHCAASAGCRVYFIDHEESGRAYISKGFQKKQKLAILTPIISEVAFNWY